MNWLLNSVLFVACVGGGDSDSPYNMPKLQTVQKDNLLIVSVEDTVTLTTSNDDFTGESGNGRHNVVVNDTGTPGGTLVSSWEEQDGTDIKVETKKGAGESVKEFVKRHKATVELMKEAFPPR
jgi:hypothetical protein